jgi:diadenosine tetraphosphate (Ap4A) HIT family hydrolase
VAAGDTAVVASGDATPADSAGPAAGAAASNGAPVDGCVFCAAAAHPAPLLQTDGLLLIPDLYPLVPGHLLVITRGHYLCVGATPAVVRAELPALADEAADFLRQSYGVEPLLWENGVTGQTVFHAHLHLIPLNVDGLLDQLEADPGSVEISGWDDVVERFQSAGEYHYIHVGKRTWLVDGNGAMNWEGRRRLAMAAGLSRTSGKLRRDPREAEVAEIAERWRAWVEAGRPGLNPAPPG